MKEKNENKERIIVSFKCPKFQMQYKIQEEMFSDKAVPLSGSLPGIISIFQL